MKASTYTEKINIPSVDDFSSRYPQYAPFALADGRGLFEKLMSPKALIMARAATEMNLPAVQGIADLCNDEFSSAIKIHAKKFISQFVGAVVCLLMEANGYARSGKKKSVNHCNFSKSEFYVPAKTLDQLSLERDFIENLIQWSPDKKAHQGEIQVIDFFCGCGGMSLGFAASGKFKMLGGVDIKEDAVKTYEQNIGVHGYQQDIVNLYEEEGLLEEFLKKIKYDRSRPSVVIGCAPCQGFSAHRKKNKGPDDKRNSLVGIFASIATEISPDCIVIENVPELLSEKYSSYFQEAKKTFEDHHYIVNTTVVNAAEFGVPQARCRALIIAMKHPFSMPKPLYGQSEFRTVRDAIGKLPPVEVGAVDPNDKLHRCANHRKTTIDTIRMIPHDGGSRPNGIGPKCLDEVSGFYDVYGRLFWEKPSITITHYARNPASGRFVHPEQDRGLTLREMACLQSFPLDFDFSGSFDSIAEQIGEAVPPVLSAAVAGSVLWDMENKDFQQ